MNATRTRNGEYGWRIKDSLFRAIRTPDGKQWALYKNMKLVAWSKTLKAAKQASLSF